MTIEFFIDNYKFLSNFYPCNIEFEGITYLSVEHAYQASKTLNIEDRRIIAGFVAPAATKRYSREKFFVVRKDFHEIKLSIMENLVRQKFQSEPLKSMLLETKDEMLIEGNWWKDMFWGVYNGQGLNHLGNVLMKIREELSK